MAVTHGHGVVGCVYFAHQRLAALLGEPPAGPSYDWCEDEWRAAPAGALPPVGDKGLPDALLRYLHRAWQDHGQGSLF